MLRVAVWNIDQTDHDWEGDIGKGSNQLNTVDMHSAEDVSWDPVSTPKDALLIAYPMLLG